MKYLLILISTLLFLASCMEKELPLEEPYDDEANTIEIVDTDTDTDTLPYIAESGPVVTKIISIVSGSIVETEQGFEDCGKYKYTGHYRINSIQPQTIYFKLSRNDRIKRINDVSGFLGDSIEIVGGFTQGSIDSTTILFSIKAAKDTLQTKAVQIALLSGIPLSYSNGFYNYPQITKKFKCVGELFDENGQKHLYGTNKWMELYWAKKFGKTITAQTPIRITEAWIPQLGDVLKWSDGHTGTIITNPTSIIRKRPKSEGGAEYRQNRFYLSEMNTRCRNEKTIKFMWHKSYDENTLKGANKSRGAAKFYYRY